MQCTVAYTRVTVAVLLIGVAVFGFSLIGMVGTVATAPKTYPVAVHAVVGVCVLQRPSPIPIIQLRTIARSNTIATSFHALKTSLAPRRDARNQQQQQQRTHDARRNDGTRVKGIDFGAPRFENVQRRIVI